MPTETSWSAQGSGRARATRCPSCDGLVAPGVEWCSQCYRRLVPVEPQAPPAPQADVPAPQAAPPAPDTSPEPAAGPGSHDDFGRALDELAEAAAALDEERGPAPHAPEDEWSGALSGLAAAAASLSEGSQTPETPPTPKVAQARSVSGAITVRATPGEFTWTCPKCDRDNRVGVRTCTTCGARFEALFEPPPTTPKVPANRVFRLSLFFPGLGHWAAGRLAEGVARAVVFGWTVISALAILLSRGSAGPGPFLPLLVLYLAAAGGIYGVTAEDARRAAEGRAPVVSSRVLLYSTVGLMLFTVAVLLLFGVRASGR